MKQGRYLKNLKIRDRHMYAIIFAVTTPYICHLFWGFSNVCHSACVWPTALKLGCVTNFDMLFRKMGIVCLNLLSRPPPGGVLIDALLKFNQTQE